MTSAVCLKCSYQRANNTWAGSASRVVLGLTGASRPCHRSISIVGDQRLEVCDRAHWAFVMKMAEVDCGKSLSEVSENPRRSADAESNPAKADGHPAY